ncbi:hypothetical protein L249_0174 [Ophiocordyceps polyrhachis-furcata BCC 54312]|uniref:Uncharacterized protein n=1 Tax=Ophiocordyceps polyrhachis-furcata BCC 54312 TaxID=1330021 RepID=A0A367LDJ8_9HYPO|nr:hypothetical protein L249_0174 [Ophiocordyceps polyrhachis-furcata BCC 54312]
MQYNAIHPQLPSTTDPRLLQPPVHRMPSLPLTFPDPDPADPVSAPRNSVITPQKYQMMMDRSGKGGKRTTYRAGQRQVEGNSMLFNMPGDEQTKLIVRPRLLSRIKPNNQLQLLSKPKRSVNTKEFGKFQCASSRYDNKGQRKKKPPFSLLLRPIPSCVPTTESVEGKKPNKS